MQVRYRAALRPESPKHTIPLPWLQGIVQMQTEFSRSACRTKMTFVG